MIKVLMLIVIPILSQENWNEVKQQSETETVQVLFTMDNCIYCDIIKDEFPGIHYQVHNKRQVLIFQRMSQGKVKLFPTLGLWRKGKLSLYFGSTRIREVLSRPTFR